MGSPLLHHIKLQRSYWSTNGQFIILQFRSPLADEDHKIFKQVFSHFYDQKFLVKDFIRKNITTSVKWTSVPKFDGGGKLISRERLLQQIKDHSWFTNLDFVGLPEWIVGSECSQDPYGTVKVIFRDMPNGSALAMVLGKSLFINGQYHRMLPWMIKQAIHQCSSCLHWGHHITACRSLSPFCDKCSSPHLLHLHDHHQEHGQVNSTLPKMHCINCCTAGKDDLHRAMNASCPFFKAHFSRVRLTKLLDVIWDRQKSGLFLPYRIDPRTGEARQARLTEEDFSKELAAMMPSGRRVKADGSLDISYAKKYRILESQMAKASAKAKGKRHAWHASVQVSSFIFCFIPLFCYDS